MLPLLAVVALLAQGTAADAPIAVGTLEGRPAPHEQSPLQALIDAAAPGATVEIPAGEYHGDLVVDRPLRLVGRGRPRLVGAGSGSVIRVRAAGVTIEGVDVDGRGRGQLGRDAAGVHIAAPDAAVRDCRITRTLFGVYLREAHRAVVERCEIEGVAGRAAGEQGSGIHVWNTTGFTLTGNRIRYSRDGFYIQSSPGGRVTGNHVHDVRYPLHYMFSDDNVFEDNRFEESAAGAALMFSRRLAFRRNQFLRNRGAASVGLLLQQCEDVVAEDNLIADNARGVFSEGSRRILFRRNRIAGSDVAVVIYDSSREIRFEGNAFAGNFSPLQLVGRRTDTVFDRNFWSDARAPDLDGDGVRDDGYRLSSVFDHLRGNLTAADLMARGLGAGMLAAAEQAFPVLAPVPVVDAHPLAAPPPLPDVPAPAPGARASALGAVLSAIVCAAGIVALRSGRPAAGGAP
jgi:nitrous oxidase accessory protein